ncbi:MAG: flagellar FlbD family protein [Clostridia bacterium]|jgi:flagellar protein FlbD|nr:flagellar FlbD family protein [Clostridiaceae bacterium]
MIKLTRINNSVIYVNPDFIEFLEETPDTVVSMSTGRRLIVKESVAKIRKTIVEYKREVYGYPRRDNLKKE